MCRLLLRYCPLLLMLAFSTACPVAQGFDGESANRNDGTLRVAETNPVSSKAAKLTPKQIEIARLELQGWKKTRDSLNSGVFRARGRLQKREDEQDPKCDAKTEYYCVFDYRQRLFRFDHKIPTVVRQRDANTGNVTRTVTEETGRYISTPDRSYEWSPEDPPTIYARGPLDKPKGQTPPFDVRLLGMGSTGDFWSHEIR